ncbi:gas vesicle protein [Kribbella sp. HUAS MG21]|uniref:Gas vesicle protein n=1 Tax=Kribbella sp. HUAS MG21 TaxID=3160966 RepID=A0AAU7TE08_9ACTN
MATPRKTTAKKSAPVKKATATRTRSPNGQHAPAKSLRAVAVTAARELAQLIGQVPEGIIGVEQQDDGWRVQVEVVESHRIPETTDILAVYEVDVDHDGDVISYRRADRYVRGRIQD